MAKVPFTKLGLTKNQNVEIIKWNEQDIEVKQYLPINDKLELVSNVINFAHDGNANYSNPVQVEVYTALEILYTYTNINFTEKQKEDTAKLYDLVTGSGLLAAIIKAIPKEEYVSIIKGIRTSINAIYAYQNSVMGVLEAVSTDYSDLNLDALNIKEALGDPENLTLLKNVLTKLG